MGGLQFLLVKAAQVILTPRLLSVSVGKRRLAALPEAFSRPGGGRRVVTLATPPPRQPLSRELPDRSVASRIPE